MRLQVAAVTTTVSTPVTLTLPSAIDLTFGSAVPAAPGADVTVTLPAAVEVSVSVGGSLGAATEGSTPRTMTLPAAIELSVALTGLTPTVPQDAPLTIEGTEVYVLQGGHLARAVPLAAAGRGYGGMARSGITATRGYSDTWSINTSRMARADADTLQGVLTAAGRVTARGTLVGGATVDCYARNITRTDIGLHQSSLSFDLLKAT
jgi:hypothetical protein